jgi:hypothetical protein
METLLVRMRPYDPRRGYVLQRYTVAGIRFQAERGWYRVERSIGEYLRAVHEVPGDEHTPLAFAVVATDAEAAALDAQETHGASAKRAGLDELKVVPARPPAAMTTEDLPRPAGAREDDKDARRGKRERE